MENIIIEAVNYVWLCFKGKNSHKSRLKNKKKVFHQVFVSQQFFGNVKVDKLWQTITHEIQTNVYGKNLTKEFLFYVCFYLP